VGFATLSPPYELRRSRLTMTKFRVTVTLTVVTDFVTYAPNLALFGRGPAGMPDCAGECGARVRICNPLPGGIGQQPPSTTTRAR